jgi:hypothetical protein
MPNHEVKMCRNIKTLFNFDPPATEEEIKAASLQFIRKISGFQRPSKVNQIIFDKSVDEVTNVASILLRELTTDSIPKNREVEAAKARARTERRFK